MMHVASSPDLVTAPAAVTDAPTACVLCSQNCGLRVDTDGERITAVRADDQNPFTEGYSCNKAYRIAHYADHRQRLTEPLKRQPDGSYAPIGWDQAIGEIGERLRRIQGERGPDAVAMLGVGGQGNHLSVLYALALMVGSGTRWWFNALAQEKTQRALVDSWMMKSPGGVMQVGHLEEADYAVILGSNPTMSQRGVAPMHTLRAFQKDPARTLVVVDPRATETARRADRHLAIEVGCDAWLLMALAAVIVQERLYEEAFVAARTVGFEAIAASLRAIDVDEMAARCGLPTADVREVARGFAAAGRASIEMDLGLEQSRFNPLTAYLARLILALTDNLGRPGGSIFVGIFGPDLPPWPAPQPAKESGIMGVALMAPAPMYSPNLFAEEVLTEREDRIRAVIVEGANPALSFADRARTEAAFAALELSVVIEPTHTETTRLADYVLPTPVGYEKWESSSFPKPYPLLGLQIRPPVLPAPPNALPEPEIYHRLAKAMGLVPDAPALLRGLAEDAARPLWGLVYGAALFAMAALRAGSRRRMAALVLFWLYETLGPTLRAPQLAAVWFLCHGAAWTRRAAVARALPDTAGVWNRAAVGNRLFKLAMAHPEGVVLAKSDPARGLDDFLGYDDARIRLAPPQMLEEIQRALAHEEAPDPDYPFVLNGGMRTHWTANTNMRDPAWRKGRGPHCALRINPDDAARLGVAKGEMVRVRSRRGAVELPALPERHVKPGHIHIPNGFGTRYPDPETGEVVAEGVCINWLTDAMDRDPFTGCPHHKYVRCQVERVG